MIDKMKRRYNNYLEEKAFDDINKIDYLKKIILEKKVIDSKDGLEKTNDEKENKEDNIDITKLNDQEINDLKLLYPTFCQASGILFIKRLLYISSDSYDIIFVPSMAPFNSFKEDSILSIKLLYLSIS